MGWIIGFLLIAVSVKDFACFSELSSPTRVKVELSVLTWARRTDDGDGDDTYAVQYDAMPSDWRDVFRGRQQHFDFTADAEDFYGKRFRVRAERGNQTSAWVLSKPVQCAHLHTCAPLLELKVETDRVHLWMKHRDGSLKEKEGGHIKFRLLYWKRNSADNKQEPEDTSTHIVLKDLESEEEYCFQAMYLLFDKPRGQPSRQLCAVIPETSNRRNLRIIMFCVLTLAMLSSLAGCLYLAYKHHRRIKALLQPPLDIPDHIQEFLFSDFPVRPASQGAETYDLVSFMEDERAGSEPENARAM